MGRATKQHYSKDVGIPEGESTMYLTPYAEEGSDKSRWDGIAKLGVSDPAK